MGKTGYSVYSADAKRRRKHNQLSELHPPLPAVACDIVYADPPWDYGGKLQYARASKGADAIDFNKKIFISSASFQYPTLRREKPAAIRDAISQMFPEQVKIELFARQSSPGWLS